MTWCIGHNYRRHADEVGMSSGDYPVAFVKGPNAVQDPGAPIIIPERAGTAELDYEGELVVIIGKACKDVTRDHALEYVAGYTCGNDVSARDWQLKKGGSQWCRGKSFDTFAPLGPCLVTPESIPDPSNLGIQTKVNGRDQTRDRKSTRLNSSHQIISYAVFCLKKKKKNRRMSQVTESIREHVCVALQ